MQEHEHFEELCALVSIGQLTATEYQELSQHLKTCAHCRHATEDFALILDQLPVSETDVDEKAMASLQRQSYRDRFLKRASEEGIPFSEELLHPQSPSHSWHKPVRRAPYLFAFAAAATAVVVFVVSYGNLRQTPAKQPPATARVNQLAATAAENEKSELIAQLRVNIEDLENQTETQKQVIANLQNRLKTSEINSADTHAQLVEAKAQLAQLEARLEDTDKTLAATKLELASAHSAKNEEDMALVEQQFKL